jgi:hypothetical protein
MMIARRSADCGLLAINPCSHQQMPLKSASGTSAAIVRGSEIEGRNHRDEKSAMWRTGHPVAWSGPFTGAGDRLHITGSRIDDWREIAFPSNIPTAEM